MSGNFIGFVPRGLLVVAAGLTSFPGLMRFNFVQLITSI